MNSIRYRRIVFFEEEEEEEEEEERKKKRESRDLRETEQSQASDWMRIDRDARVFVRGIFASCTPAFHESKHPHRAASRLSLCEQAM